jgi:TolB protein
MMAESQSVEFETQPVQPPERSRRTRIGLVVALLLTIGVIGAILGARAINAIGRPPANDLAFVDIQGRLHTIDDRGEHDRVFPADGLSFQFPAWSPDGSRIAAVGYGPGGGGGGVFVFDTRAEAPQPITAFQDEAHLPFYLYWTPDSRRLTFLTSERGTIALRVAATDGSGANELILEGQPMYWAHAGDDRILVHSGGNAEDAFVGETGLAASNPQPSDPQPGPFRAPSVSSTRRFSAYEVSSGENTHRLVIAARDGGTRQEIPVPSIAMFGFSPVGSQLAYVADPARLDAATVFPFGPLRVFDAVSGNDRLLLDGDVAAFFWSPDGKTIAALRIPTDEERQPTAGIDRVLVAAAGPGRPRPTEPSTAPGATLRLVFKDVATGETRSERSVQVSDLFAGQVLPFFDQYALSHRFWSRDSRSIVLPLADTRPEPQVTVIYADGSRSVELGPGAIAFWSP